MQGPECIILLFSHFICEVKSPHQKIIKSLIKAETT